MNNLSFNLLGCFEEEGDKVGNSLNDFILQGRIEFLLDAEVEELAWVEIGVEVARGEKDDNTEEEATLVVVEGCNTSYELFNWISLLSISPSCSISSSYKVVNK